MTILLDGNRVAKARKLELTSKIEDFVNQGKRAPHLCVVLVGEDPASQTYVNSKAKQCKEVGITSTLKIFDATLSETALLQEIDTLNKDTSIDGILVQLPLPNHINTQTIIESINPSKDVDGLHPENVGLLELQVPRFVPCTPKGIMTLLDAYNVEVKGKDILVIGRSRLVGKPIANLLTSRDATVTLAHSKTKNLSSHIARCDLIVVAVGHQEMFSARDFLEHQVVIDVGIHRTEAGLVGDVSKDVYNKVSAITPVPRGVGPMTIVSLLENTVDAYERGGSEV